MFLMRADPLRGQVGGGWALEIETFLGPEMATSEASAIWALYIVPIYVPEIGNFFKRYRTYLGILPDFLAKDRYFQKNQKEVGFQTQKLELPNFSFVGGIGVSLQSHIKLPVFH
jgi:hypothetical protein